MDAIAAIKARRSIRAFKPDKVPRALIYKILDAARWAPSAGNLQSWEFILVEDATSRKQLAAAALGQDFVAKAPIAIVACADTERSALKYGSRGKYFYCLVDTCAATENMLIAAASLGLGACWVGAFDNNQVRDILGLPEGVVAVAIIPIGYPAEEGKQTTRTGLGNIVHFEKYGEFEVVKTAEADERPAAGAGADGKKKKGIMDIFS